MKNDQSGQPYQGQPYQGQPYQVIAYVNVAVTAALLCTFYSYTFLNLLLKLKL